MASVEKRNGKYYVRYAVYENGTRKQKSKTFDKAREAKVFAASVENSINTGTYTDSKKQTVQEYLDEWYDTYTVGLAPNSRADLKNSKDKHIIPRIGKIPLEQLGALHIQRMYNDVLSTAYIPAKTNERGIVIRPEKHYSCAQLDHIHKCLTKALRKAVELHKIPSNPCDLTERPKIQEREMIIPEKEELSRLLQSIESDRLYPAILACALLGNRRGETLGLWWSDIDEISGQVSFSRSLTPNNLNKGTAEIRALKTKNSKRVVPLPGLFRKQLTGMKALQRENKKQYIDIYVDSPYVFTDEQGMPYKPDRISGVFKRYTAKAGYPSMTLHDLRHAYVTYLLDAGASPKVVQELVGHYDPGFTLKRYAHALESAKHKAADDISDIYQ